MELDKWEVLDWKLFAGFENGNIVITGRPNQITILGGKLTRGNTRCVWTYDLLNKAILNNKSLANKSILAKHSVLNNEEYFIVGQSDDNLSFWENYFFSREKTISQGTFVLPWSKIQNIKQYNYNTPNLVVPMDPRMLLDFRARDYSQKSIIFGSDIEPFQIEVDNWTGKIDVMPIPCSLKLKNFQAACRIDQNKVFFAGGISCDHKKILKKTFIYDLNNRTVTKTGSMGYKRYTFPAVFCNGYVYCIAGREFGLDDTAIMRSSERFNLQNFKWEELPDLNVQRCTSNAFVMQNKVFVAGGYIDQKTRTDTIEFFNEDSFKWELFNFKLDSPIEASIHLVSNSLVYFFGGRVKGGNTNVKQVIDMLQMEGGRAQRHGNELKYKQCLNKMVTVRGFYFMFGGAEPNKMNVINGVNLMNATDDEWEQSLVYTYLDPANLKGNAELLRWNRLSAHAQGICERFGQSSRISQFF